MNSSEFITSEKSKLDRIKKERIRQVHKRLHDAVTIKEEGTQGRGVKIDNDSISIRRSDLRKYLGEPLPLPYLHKPRQTLPSQPEPQPIKPGSTRGESNLLKSNSSVRLRKLVQGLQDSDPHPYHVNCPSATDNRRFVTTPIVLSTREQLNKAGSSERDYDIHKNDLAVTNNILDILSSPHLSITLLIVLYLILLRLFNIES